MGKGHRGKIAVVTGASEGIGQVFAVRLAEEGVDVAIADVKPADETVRRVTAIGRRAFAVHCDVSKPDDVAAFARAVEANFARCDILVNCAGIYPMQPFDTMTFEHWRRVMSINLDSMFLMTKAFAAGMRQRGWGRIVNIASDTVSLPVPDFAHYVASKGGVIGFTRAIATEFAQQGVTANIISPGLTRTPGTLSGTDHNGNPRDDYFTFAEQRNPMRRLGAPDDLAGAIAFLTSDDAAYISGQTFFINGGLTRA
ncbi:MAG: SDR family NAD(P)-dependent oxidoreductase [Xanthobacteraceae bacterium]